MVGVNHEFARELLWREYPTDQRGTYFRQFWDVTPHPRPDGAPTPTPQREQLYDIPPIHRWPRGLGARRARQPAARPRRRADEIVLVIRGELLKKYPNTVIYAHAAKWATTRRPHRPDQGARAGRAHRPPSWPTRRAQGPDAALRGQGRARHLLLRLRPDAEEARGGTGRHTTPTRRAGSSCSRSGPGEPRFGLDESRAAPASRSSPSTTSPGPTPASRRAATSAPTRLWRRSALTAPSSARDDRRSSRSTTTTSRSSPAAVSAARWAYLLYQAPVMVAVHAAELLKTADGLRRAMAEFDDLRAASRRQPTGTPRRPEDAARPPASRAAAGPGRPTGDGRRRGRGRQGTRPPPPSAVARRRAVAAFDGVHRSAAARRAAGDDDVRSCCCRCAWRRASSRYRRATRGRSGTSCGCGSIPTTARSTPSTPS